jgi:hypothetical protein
MTIRTCWIDAAGAGEERLRDVEARSAELGLRKYKEANPD